MSTYYDFYVGVKKDDKIEAIGPYIRKDGEYHLVPIVSRSRSFIHFDEFGYWELPIEKMAEDQAEFFTSEGWTSDERHSISCYIPYEDIRAMADDGLVQGYVTLEELNAVAASDYHPDSLWDVWVRTPEMVAEMDPETRKQYGHMSTTEKRKIESEIFLDINTNAKPVSPDVLLHIKRIKDPLSDIGLARAVIEKLNKERIFFNRFEMSSLDSGKIKIASIIKFALRYLVSVDEKQERKGLYYYWNGDKEKLQAIDDDAYNAYLDYCTKKLRDYFCAIRKVFINDWNNPDSKILSVISLNGFIIAYNRMLDAIGPQDYEFFEKRLQKLSIDFSKKGFRYTSSQYLYPHDMGDVDYDSGVMMGWPVYIDVPEEEYYKLTDEDYENVHTGFTFHIVCVKDVANEDEAIEKLVSAMKKVEGDYYTEEEDAMYRAVKQIHEQDGYIWLADTPKEKSEGLRGECQAEYDAFFDATDEIISNMKFYTPQAWTGTAEGADVAFETTDLDGNPVNSAQLFSQNKITMINIWATTCGPCIEEMPELEKMNQEFQKKGGAIVGVVSDVPVDNSKYLQEAQAIVKDTGVTYPNLKAWEGFETDLEAVGTPTTYFVDSQGKLVGDPILGAHLDKYKEIMEKYLSEAE